MKGKIQMAKIPFGLKKVLSRKGYGRIGFRNLKMFKSGNQPSSLEINTHLVSARLLSPTESALIHPQYCCNPANVSGTNNFGYFRANREEGKMVDGIYADMEGYKYQFNYLFSYTYYNYIMKKVEKKLWVSPKWGPGKYDLMMRNCHHFMQEAIKSYNSILQEKIKQYDRLIRGVKRTFDGAV